MCDCKSSLDCLSNDFFNRAAIMICTALSACPGCYVANLCIFMPNSWQNLANSSDEKGRPMSETNSSGMLYLENILLSFAIVSSALVFILYGYQ